MAKKKRPEPISEGSLSTIYKHFFGPLIRYKPQLMSIAEWMEFLFGSNDRDIISYKVRAGFRMPGLLCVAANVKIQGIGFRNIKVDDHLWVRFDATMPDSIDVEVLAGPGKRDQQFVLTSNEWNWVRLNVDEQVAVEKP